MFIRRLRSSHNCYFPPPPTTSAATKQAQLPPRYGTRQVCKVRSGPFTKCHKKIAQKQMGLDFNVLDEGRSFFSNRRVRVQNQLIVEIALEIEVGLEIRKRMG